MSRKIIKATPSSGRRRWLRPLRSMAVVAVGAAVTLGLGVTEAGAAPASQVKAQGIKYKFQNWDQDGSTRDNPVSIIFVSKKSDMVDRVYVQVKKVGLTKNGSKMTLKGVGGSRPGVNPTDPWTSKSAGRKGAFGCWGHCSAGTDIHLRTYGPDGSRGTQVYQGGYGFRPYYLIATVHFDVDENTSREKFGWQDRARGLLVKKLVSRGDWRVLSTVTVKNACSGWRDAHHWCKHDGKAQIVSIDG